jgi:HAE1 family hydrophobic/amphiphilic exporter-1
MTLPSFSVRRRVAVTMAFLAIIVLGLVSFRRLSLDLFPKIEPPMVTVITVWRGANAKDIESKVTKILEDQLATTPDLEELSSISQDNISVVQVKLRWGANIDEAANQIRSLAAAAKPLMPEEVDDPLLYRLNLASIPILMLSVTVDQGRADEHADFIEKHVVNELQRVDGVASVVMFNQRKKQLLVQVDREKMERYSMSLQQVEGALKANNLSLPAGTLDIGRSVYTIRAPGEFQSTADVENVIVGQNLGSLIYVKDLASVKLGLEDRTSAATVNGGNSLLLMVQRESAGNTVDVAQAVLKRVDELQHSLGPQGYHIATVMDLSQNIVMIIGSLTETVYFAGAIVFVVVLLFLRRVRSSLIVAISIPVSLIAGFALLAVGGYTINIITLVAMAIAVGLVVDDSIVVTDNVVRHLDQGESGSAAAANGADEVRGAVSAATFTNAAIFMPILFVGGIIGIMFKELAFVIITTLMVSLLVALMLVPVISQRFLRRATRQGPFLRWSERQMLRLESAYGKVIAWALNNRKKVVVVAMSSFAVSLLLTRVIGVDFIPQLDGAVITINAELPIGTNLDRTMQVAGRIEEIVKRRIPEAQVITNRAGTSQGGLAVLMGGRQGSNIAMVMIRVPSLNHRSRTTFEMAEAIRGEIKAIPDLVSLEIDGSNPVARVTSGGQKPLTVELFSVSGSLDELRTGARHVRSILEGTPGVVNVSVDSMDDVPELRITVDRLEAARLGVPMAAVAVAVRTSMYGSTVTRYRGGDEDIDMVLRLRNEDRTSPDDILNLTVPSMSGAQIRLSTIARLTQATSPIEIRRMDKQRELRAMADVSGRALGDVANEVEARIASDRATGKLSQGISTRFAGDVKEQRAMVVDLSLAMLLSMFLVYMVMAAQFESFLDPFVVMFSVPFGITGALLAFPLAGTTLSLTGFIGMIIQIGLVVKNAIVLVDYINGMRDQGMSLDDAVRRGCERRLRPVLMTALAILGGMLPLALARGEGSEMWRPMAVAVIGGVLVSTLVTLVLIPSVYALTDRWRKRGAEHVTDEHTPEAIEA